MDPNTHSTQPPEPPASPEPPAPPVGSPRLASLAAAKQELAALDLGQLPDTALTQDLMELRQLVDGLEGLWLQELAAADARGAAGAEVGAASASTAAWLRNRRRLSIHAAHTAVRTARALFGGALPETAAALVAGDISPAHAQAIADGTRELADHLKLEAEPILVEAARRVDPPRVRQAADHLCQVADPEGAERAAAHHHARRGVWVSPTWQGMVAIDGLLDPEAGSIVQAALEPLARPADANDERTGRQRAADALTELARRSLEGGWLPKAGGVRPQLLVTVDLDSLLGRPGGLGGETGWAGPLDREACRRLACDGMVTRVLVSRHPSHAQAEQGADDPAERGPAALGPDDPQADGAGGLGEATEVTGHLRGAADAIGGRGGAAASVAAWLGAAAAKLPPVLGGAPRQPLDVGRATRVVAPAQRSALAVRDQGCVFPDCDRPLPWCDAHHLWHWADGGPTDLNNLALLCRAHHRQVHEGGWRLIRGPDGRFSAHPADPGTPRPHRHRRPTSIP
jgi:hypothetical protein